MKPMAVTIAAISMAVSLSAKAQIPDLFGPKTYEECVLENMRGVTSDLAAAQIADACRTMHSPKRQEGKPLTLGSDYTFSPLWNELNLEIWIINRSTSPINYVGLTSYQPCSGRTKADDGDLGGQGNSLAPARRPIKPGDRGMVSTIRFDVESKRKFQNGEICLFPTVYWDF